jgi:PIN domain nuclease of toxin-antitoxin system
MAVEHVADASAVLALLRGERGADYVQSVIADSVISAVNFCEVLTKLIQGGTPADAAIAIVDDLHIRIVEFSRFLAETTASLSVVGRPRGLSLGDRACLALGKQRQAPVVTADRAWRELDVGVEVVVIR